jgi:DNA transformation protein
MPAATPSPFTTLVLEQMSALGGVQAKKMFGGWGIFRMGLMFAVVIGDELYFKADEANVGRFESRGLKPFIYEAKGRRVSLRYYQAPPETLEEPSAMAEWAGEAYACALRHQKPPQARKARPRPD